MKSKKYLKKAAALSLSAAMVVTAVPVLPKLTVSAADEDYVTDENLSEKSTKAPEKDTVVPDANQYKYQKQELAAFAHFGPNTFNEIEWGEHYGDRTPAEIFTLQQDFDEETFVKTLKDAGFQKLIVTAKHHDGFCIWNSKYTDYNVAKSTYSVENGFSGDVLEEISKACTKYDMDMGLYLSPWDINAKSYGYYDEAGNPTSKENDALDYNEYYDNQLKEILGNKKYGNDGHFSEVWMDGAKGSGANAQDYDFVRWFNTIQTYEGKKAGYDADCMLFGAEAYTTVRWIGNEGGWANEETWAKSKGDKSKNTVNHNNIGNVTKGFEDGNMWTVPEADARITSGWFWGNNKKTPKTITELGNMYFDCVGHNATLLLNVPPNNKGTIDKAIQDRVVEFGEEIAETFRNNYATQDGVEVSATSVRGMDTAYKPSNVIDGKDQTYWTVDDGKTSGTLMIDLGATRTFDVVSIEEAIEFGQRITGFTVEYRKENGKWESFAEGTTIGSKRLCRTAPVKGDAVRITVRTDSNVITEEKVPMVSEVGVFKASEGFELSSAVPDGMTVIDINDNNFKFSNGWTKETGQQYTNGTNTWANGKADGSVYAEVNFTGSWISLIGTVDPNHGKATIYLDGEEVKKINTASSPRQVGFPIFESDTLDNGQHTLKIVADEAGKAIGLEAAYVIDNGGLGMVGFATEESVMNEDSTINVKLVRTGGLAGGVTVTATPNPGSAIQDDFDTENIQSVTFAEGETEKEIPVITKRNTNKTGTQYFTVELSCDNEDVILGKNNRTRITILDDESLIEPEIPEGTYTEGTPFVFPSVQGTSATLEAETMELHNVGNNETWPLQVKKADWASNGAIINSMNNGDSVKLHYVATKPGKYTVTLTLRSGDTKNGLIWKEAKGKIKDGSAENIGASDDAGATHTTTFTFEVKEPGRGVLSFIAPQHNAPQMDKFEIELTEEVVTLGRIAVKAPTKTTYEIGEELDLSGMEITAVYTNGDTVEIKDATVDTSKFNSKEAGIYTITVTYQGKSVSFDVTVKGKDEPQPPVDEVNKEALNKAIEAAKKLNAEDYTEDTWNVFAEALEAAKKVAENKDAQQKDVDEAVKALEDAKNALKPAEDNPTPIPPTENLFDDVRPGDWYYDEVFVVNEAELMTGLTDTHFGALDTLVRAQFAVILHRIAGEPKAPEYTEKFKDVPADQWYTDAIMWAASEGIITGYENGSNLFGINDAITREQMATIMYRYANTLEDKEVTKDGKLDDFPDAGKVQEFAKEALAWCVAEEIITGDKGNLNPQGSALRAECAAVVARFYNWVQ